MATKILTPTIAQYHLPEFDRQSILSKTPTPQGKISQAAIHAIEIKRLDFIKKNGNKYGQKNNQ